tara:strand:- start:2798 stop:3367 length:570 start_codon:yes stop_codon:yes gene_type:complete
MFNHEKIKEDVWLFGYGSLIWNPAIEYLEKQPMLVCGFHRKFCLKTYLGRGSKNCPGLMLALDKGGSCKGLGYRISSKKAAKELEIIWSREMAMNSYIPRWLSARIGERKLKVLGFVVNRKLDRYVGKLEDQKTAEFIYRAEGFLGKCSEYLYNTAEQLEYHGLKDKYLYRIRDIVHKLELQNDREALS